LRKKGQREKRKKKENQSDDLLAKNTADKEGV
jgi:hypothetical protein